MKKLTMRNIPRGAATLVVSSSLAILALLAVSGVINITRFHQPFFHAWQSNLPIFAAAVLSKLSAQWIAPRLMKLNKAAPAKPWRSMRNPY